MTRPPDFRILTDRSGTRVEIAIHGELDLATAPQLTTAFERVSELDDAGALAGRLRDAAALVRGRESFLS